MNKTIVIVDDEPLITTMLPQLMNRLNYDVVGVGKNKEELISLVRKHNPNIICTDNDMPIHNEGLEGIATLRREGYLQPVILFTGRAHAMVPSPTWGPKEQAGVEYWQHVADRDLNLLAKPIMGVDLARLADYLIQEYISRQSQPAL